MIEFGSHFSIAAEQIEYMATDSEGAGGYPYRLTVYLKSGRACAVSYKSEEGRDAEKARVARQVDAERHAYDERILNRLYLIKDVVERVDKRQLRVWRQLKELLRLPPDTEIE